LTKQTCGRPSHIAAAIELQVERLIEIHASRTDCPIERLSGPQEGVATLSDRGETIAPASSFVGTGQKERFDDHAMSRIRIATELRQGVRGTGHQRGTTRYQGSSEACPAYRIRIGICRHHDRSARIASSCASVESRREVVTRCRNIHGGTNPCESGKNITRIIVGKALR